MRDLTGAQPGAGKLSAQLMANGSVPNRPIELNERTALIGPVRQRGKHSPLSRCLVSLEPYAVDAFDTRTRALYCDQAICHTPPTDVSQSLQY